MQIYSARSYYLFGSILLLIWYINSLHLSRATLTHFPLLHFTLTLEIPHLLLQNLWSWSPVNVVVYPLSLVRFFCLCFCKCYCQLHISDLQWSSSANIPRDGTESDVFSLLVALPIRDYDIQLGWYSSLLIIGSSSKRMSYRFCWAAPCKTSFWPYSCSIQYGP